MMNKVIKDHVDKNVKIYIDEMLIKSIGQSNHLKDFEEIFQIIKQNNMMINPNKYNFFESQWKFF